MTDEESQPFYDLAWKVGAAQSTNFDGDELTAISFTPEDFEAFCQSLFDKPSAWLQIGVGPLHEGDILTRLDMPKRFNPEWWKFEPLYLAPKEEE